jgi:membrane associated rhomboid family serine protease
MAACRFSPFLESIGMRPPPPPTYSTLNANIVTATVGLLALAVTLAWWAGRDVSALFPTRAGLHEPWRLLTAILPHVNVLHLIFNLYWLWTFGTLAEESFGHVRTALLYLFLAAGSNAIAGALGENGIGLSGVGYGLFGMWWVLSRKDERFRDAVDGNTIAMLVGWFFLCIFLTKTGAMRVANVAHGAGAMLGILTGLAVAGHGLPRYLYAGAAGALVALALFGGSFVRPYLHPHEDAGRDFAQKGLQELKAGRYQEGAELYERAVQADSDHANWWYNLGVAYVRLRKADEAEAALARAVRLQPDQPTYRRALFEWKADLAFKSYEKGDFARAVERYRQALELNAEDARVWYHLGLAYERLADIHAAVLAYQRATELAPDDEAYRAALMRLRTDEDVRK